MEGFGFTFDGDGGGVVGDGRRNVQCPGAIGRWGVAIVPEHRRLVGCAGDIEFVEWTKDGR